MSIGAMNGYTQGVGNTTQTNKTEKSKDKQPVKLSPRAQKYLRELEKKYGNMNFMVASYDTDEEAQKYLSKTRSSKEFNVLIDPETLEEMASNEKVREKYEGFLSNAGNYSKQLKEELGEDADKVSSFGISIDKNGIITFFAQISENNTKHREEQENAVKNAKENKSDETKKKELKQVSADSMEKLIEKLKQIFAEQKANQMQTEKEKAVGGSVDYRA